jgi:5-methyltetrahydropteroyltriglutamate--homocysteine methyltransferase
MVDVSALKELDDDREVQVGVIDIRSLYIETDDEIVERIHKVLDVVPAERVYLTTDCGLKALPRFVAHEKLRALSRAAKRVRAEIGAPVAA